MNNEFDYSNYFSSPELLANAVLNQYEKEIGNLTFPINPFKILKDLNIKILIRNFKNLEGLYIPKSSDGDIDVVAINYNRSIYRQRFTAAHEICHYVKDRNNNTIICPINGNKNAIEKFADNFAASLLMPINELKKQVNKYLNENGYIDLENVIYVSEYFGVSFEGCVYSIAYKLHKIEGDTESKSLKRRIVKAKPEKLREKFGIRNYLKLTRELVDFCCYARPKGNTLTNIKFKQFLVLNENRLENININENELNYILADIRLNNDFSKYKSETDKNILEALGNIEMLEYVLNTNEKIDVWKLSKLQKLLYKYTPFGSEMLFPRQSNNIINGAEISTVDYKLVPQELIIVGEKINDLISKKDTLTLHEYILEAIKIHHRLTVIHPLEDGNGRCCRALLLWILRLKNVLPIYIKIEDKSKYLEALNKIDTQNDYGYLELFILQQIIYSLVIFDEKLKL